MDELEGYKVLSGADPAEDYMAPFISKKLSLVMILFFRLIKTIAT